MTLPDDRHYSEEELLMHLLGEELPEVGTTVSAHLGRCGQCRAIFQEYQQVRESILRWQAPEISEENWRSRKIQLLDTLREERRQARTGGLLPSIVRMLQGAWSYALENPLPTLGYVVVAVAFASERTITIFRLDRILPATNEVLAILKQVL
ncbi:MAG TPA: hypothetical protein VE398_08510 [Acidobacteriota bacterium]|nr:hypothetical protein [Acidobacteriota bacterium]